MDAHYERCKFGRVRLIFSDPTVTVGIPVYQGAATVGKALASVNLQTFGSYEVLIIDDGSSDETFAVIQRHMNKRIRLRRNQKNLGLAAVRNQILQAARGEYIAWLDADDEMAPNRLKVQVERFRSNPRLVLCGSWAWIKNSAEPTNSRELNRTLYRVPWSSSHIKVGQGFANLFITSSCMQRNIRSQQDVLAFKPSLEPAEDYGYWNEMIKLGGAEIIPRPLASRTILSSGASHARFHQQRSAAAVIGAEYLRTVYGVQMDERQYMSYETFTQFPERPMDYQMVSSLLSWLTALIHESKAWEPQNRSALSYWIAVLLQRLLRRNPGIGARGSRLFLNFALGHPEVVAGLARFMSWKMLAVK